MQASLFTTSLGFHKGPVYKNSTKFSFPTKHIDVKYFTDHLPHIQQVSCEINEKEIIMILWLITKSGCLHNASKGAWCSEKCNSCHQLFINKSNPLLSLIIRQFLSCQLINFVSKGITHISCKQLFTTEYLWLLRTKLIMFVSVKKQKTWLTTRAQFHKACKHKNLLSMKFLPPKKTGLPTKFSFVICYLLHIA